MNIRSVKDSLKEYGVDGKYLLPSDDLPLKFKQSKKFARYLAEAIWSEYCRMGTHLPSVNAQDNDNYTYQELRAYAEGRQSTQKYRTVLAPSKVRKVDNGRQSRDRLSWEIESPAPRYVESVREIIKETDHTIQFRATDPINKKLRQRERYAMEEQRRNAWLKDRMAKMGMETKPTEFDPKNEQEEDLYMREVFEMSHERGLSLIVQEIFRHSGLEGADTTLRDDTHDDHFILGLAVWKRTITWHDKIPRLSMRYCDPNACIFPKSQHKDYRDAHYLAEFRLMSVGDVRSELQRNIGEAETWDNSDELKLRDAIKLVHGAEVLTGIGNLGIVDSQQLINGYRDSHGRFPYDYLKMPVLDGVYLSYDTDAFSIKKTAKTEFIEQVPATYKPKSDRKVERYGRNTWYQYLWVIGTELMLSWGRMPWNVNECPFIIQRVTNRPIVSQMIPILDKLQVIKIKTDKAWQKAAPKGMKWNWKELQGMLMNGAKLDPFEAIRMRREEGDMVVNGNNDTPYKRANSGGSQEMEGGVGKMLEEGIRALSFEFEKLNRITGINETMLGEAPKTNQLVGTTEIALSGSRSRIKPIYAGYFNMKSRAATVLAKTIAAIVRFYPDAFPEINESSLTAIKLGAEIYDYKYDIRARIVPNDQMRASLYQDLNDAVARGVLGPDDRLELASYIESNEFDFARQLLRVRIRNNESRAQQSQQAMIAAETERDKTASQGRVQESVARVQAETEKELTVNEAQAALMRAMEVLKGAIESQHIQEEARADSAKSQTAKKPAPNSKTK